MRLRLPLKENIWITGTTDPIHRHYHPVISYFMNKRLTGALELLGNAKPGRLLDIGYGGGVFLLELSGRCGELYGIDIHKETQRVAEMLAREGVAAKLSYGDVTNIPFPDGYFDAIVCVSVLEFVDEPDLAFSEMARVLNSGGSAVIGFPVENLLTDIAFFGIGVNARKAHPVNQDDILASAKKKFNVEKIVVFPRKFPLRFSLFAHARLKKIDGQHKVE